MFASCRHSFEGIARKTVLQANVHKHVEKGSDLFTDEWSGYIGLHKDFQHQIINHAECYVRGNVHTNGLENFWALLKRSSKGTHVRSRRAVPICSGISTIKPFDSMSERATAQRGSPRRFPALQI